MIGAIIGDIIGSRFEFNNINTKEFEFFGEGCEFTDDTVMTIAVAEALLYTRNPDELGNVLRDIMRDYGHGYPDVGYGGMFRQWLMSADPQPYNSFGNGSAMRVSPCGYAAESLEEVLLLAKASAEISHNHPEGIKGAQAIAAAIYMARNGIRKDGIKQYIEDNFYKLDFTLNDVKQEYHFSESCQDTVPQAIQSFLLANSFEDTIRNAISIGGDSDTIACIAGSIAEAYYGIPDEMIDNVKKYLPKCFVDVIDRFYANFIDNSAIISIKNKLKKYIEKHNSNIRLGSSGRYINLEDIYFNKLDLSCGENRRYYGCFKRECGWFDYDVYTDRGITDYIISGPFNKTGILKALRVKLGISKEICDLEDFTEQELNIFIKNQWPLEDFSVEFCKDCKHNNWCTKENIL